MDRLTVLFAATTVAFGATSAWFAQQLFAERQQAASLAERIVALESARDQVSGRPMARANSTPADHPEPSGVPGVPGGPDASRAPPGSRGAFERLNQFRSAEAQLLRNAQYRERWLAMTTLQLQRTYADLRRLLGLSDTEYASFLATMAQFELEQTLRNFEAPLEKRTDLARRLASAQQTLADMQAARRQALRDALGEAQYRQWVDHERTAPGREELERWRMELAVAGQPLTPGQAEGLLPILVEHQRRINALPIDAALVARALATSGDASSALVESERHIASRAEINAWLGDTLRGVLTVEQRDLMTSDGQREIELSRAQLELNRLRLEGG